MVSAITTWTVDPIALIIAVLLGGWYIWGVRRLARQGRGWPAVRSAAFLGVGLGSYLLVTMSCIGAYADVLFSMRAAQIIVLLMITPLGLALGAPLTLLRELLSPSQVMRCGSWLHSGVGKVVAFPATTSVALIATPWLLYFTGWYPAMLTSNVLDECTRLALVFIGFGYFWSRLQVDPVPRRYPYLVSIWLTFAEVIFDAALGLTLWFSGQLVAGSYYLSLARPWGPDPHLDQIVGAGVLWIVGDLAGLPFVGALATRMMREDAQQAKVIDRELDLTEDVNQPWWENDPVLAERFARGRQKG